MKFKQFIFIFLFSLFLSVQVISAPTSTVSGLKFVKYDINKNKNYKVFKPVFNDKKKFKEVNDNIDEMLDINKIKAEEKEICIDDPERCSMYELEVSPVVKYSDENVISLVINYYSYLGGAHGGSWVKSILVDRKTGKDISYTLLNNEMPQLEQKISNFASKNPDFGFYEDSLTDFRNIKSYTLVKNSKNTVLIIYNEYAIGPYSSGMLTFEYNTATKKLYFINGDIEKTTDMIEVR